MGLKFKAQYDEGKHVLRMFGKQYSYSGNISSLSSFGDVLKEATAMVDQFDADMMIVNVEDPSNSGEKGREFDSITLGEWTRRNLKSREVVTLLNFLLWTICTVTADEISYFWWLYYLRNGHGYNVLADIRGGAQQDKVVGGLQQVCDRMAADIGDVNIRMRCPVKEIHQDDNEVRIIVGDGSVFRGRTVIVTAPPVVCADIKFTPALPPKRQRLHEQFRPGAVIKVYVLYDKWWWREKGMSGEMISDEEPVTLYYDATTEKVPGFIGFIPAHLAIKWGQVSSDDLKKAIVNQLVREFGPDAANPTEIIIRQWLSDDIWCRGAYAGSMKPGTLSQCGDAIRKPVGRIHWAGTETARDWCGYFEGSIESADRVVEEVSARLGTPKTVAKL